MAGRAGRRRTARCAPDAVPGPAAAGMGRVARAARRDEPRERACTRPPARRRSGWRPSGRAWRRWFIPVADWSRRFPASSRRRRRAPEQAVAEVLRGMARLQRPRCGHRGWRTRSASPVPQVEAGLTRLEGEGQVLRGRFTAAGRGRRRRDRVVQPARARTHPPPDAGPPATGDRAGVERRPGPLPGALAAPHRRRPPARDERSPPGRHAAPGVRDLRCGLGARRARGPTGGLRTGDARPALPVGRGDVGTPVAASGVRGRRRRAGSGARSGPTAAGASHPGRAGGALPAPGPSSGWWMPEQEATEPGRSPPASSRIRLRRSSTRSGAAGRRFCATWCGRPGGSQARSKTACGSLWRRGSSLRTASTTCGR